MREPSALPRNPPTPAAAPMMPSSSSWMNPVCPLLSVSAFTANAANIMRNPVSTRMEPLPHSATTTYRAIGARPAFLGSLAVSDAGTSPSVTSTHDGMRMACTAPTAQMSAVNHRAPEEPNAQFNPLAIAPNTPPAARPNTASLALVFDRVISGGSTLGVTAALSTMRSEERRVGNEWSDWGSAEPAPTKQRRVWNVGHRWVDSR